MDPTMIIRVVTLPIASMYGMFTYIYHENQPNLGKYTIHGWYGLYVVINGSSSSKICIYNRGKDVAVSRDPWDGFLIRKKKHGMLGGWHMMHLDLWPIAI